MKRTCGKNTDTIIVCDGCGRRMQYVGEIHEIFYNTEDRFPDLCGYGKEIPENEAPRKRKEVK